MDSEQGTRSWYAGILSWLPAIAQFGTLVVVAIALLWPAPATSNMLFAGWAGSDLMISHWPTALLIQRTFAQSHTLPLWNPYYAGGQPLGADPLAALFYLPTHLVHFFSLRNYYLVLILVHLIWAGLGVLLLASRAPGLPRLPALLAAVSYMATPRLLAHLGAGHITIVQTVAWYPWLALACWATARNPRRWGALLGICLAMMLLAGHPQMAYYGMMMTAALAIWLLLTRVARWRKLDWRALCGSAAGLTGAAVVGGLLAAIYLLPLLEFTALSTRQLALPSRDAYPLKNFLHSLIFQPPPVGLYWESLISPGLVVLALALLGAVMRWRKAWPMVLGIVLVGELAMGAASPVYSRVVHLLPDLDLFRAPTRIWFIALMLIALLAGLGADALLGGIRYVVARGIRHDLYRGAVVAAAGMLAVLFVAFSLVTSEAGYTHTGDVDALTTPSTLARTAAQLAGNGRIYGVQENLPQVDAVELQVSFADGWNPLLIESYVRYMTLAGGYYASGYQLHLPIDAPWVKPHATLLGLMNVSILVSRRPLSDPHFVKVEEADGTLIYKNTADAGPAYLIRPGPGGNPPSLSQFQRIGTDMRIVTMTPEQQTFTFSSSTTAYVVIAMPAFPGWVAELDGHVVPTRLFAGVMPAIKVGPGKHTLSYTYKPASMRDGALLSLIGLLAALAWLIVGRFWKPEWPRPRQKDQDREEHPQPESPAEIGSGNTLLPP
jgi:hypothetical protein